MAVFNPSLSHAVAITGNTSGALATVSTGTLYFAGGNNVTLSQNANSVTISAANQTNQTAPAGNIAGAGFTSTTTTGSVIAATQNSAGLSMAVPAFLTTYAAQTNQTAPAGNIAGAGFTSTTTAGVAVVATQNSAGLSMAVPAFLTTAAQSNHSHNFATTTTNGSQIVVGTTNSAGATIGVPAFLTTYAAQTNQTVASGNIAGVGTTFNGTNVSGSLTLNSNGLNLALSAAAAAGGGANVVVSNIGNTSGTSGSYWTQVVFAGGNNITLSASQGNGGNSANATVTISAPNNGFSASGGSSGGVVTFSNSANAVTFSNSNGQVVMSHSLQQLSNTSAITASALNTSQSSAFVHTSQSSLFQQSSLMSNFAGDSTGFSGINVSGSMTVDSNGIALSMSVADPGGAGAALTYMTYQNRQLGASSSTQLTNGQIWMVPFRIAGGYVSASTIQYIQSLSGTYTSAVAATHGETMRWCIYSANTTNSSVFDSASSGSFTWQFWNSGTSSGSWAYNGLTSSSNGTPVLTQAAGVRMMNIPFGSSIAPGLYMMAFMQSTTTAGYSGLLSRYGHIVDAPMLLAMGNGFGTATATSIGYVDAGTFSTTSAAFPTQVNLSQVRQHSNLVPYFKIGAL